MAVTLLVVFAGLPGSGKSVLARGVSDAIGATYLRSDTIEAAIVSTMSAATNPDGYLDQLSGKFAGSLPYGLPKPAACTSAQAASLLASTA